MLPLLMLLKLLLPFLIAPSLAAHSPPPILPNPHTFHPATAPAVLGPLAFIFPAFFPAAPRAPYPATSATPLPFYYGEM